MTAFQHTPTSCVKGVVAPYSLLGVSINVDILSMITDFFLNHRASFPQDDLRRANRDLSKGKEEMKNLTSKIGKFCCGT